MANDVGPLVEVEDADGISGVRHVGEDVADLPPDVIAVSNEQLQHTLYEELVGYDCLHLAVAPGSDVGKHPARLPPHYLLVVLQHLLQQTQQVVRKQLVCMLYAPRRHVPQYSYRRNQQSHRWLLQMLNNSGNNSSLHHHLNLVPVGVRVV